MITTSIAFSKHFYRNMAALTSLLPLSDIRGMKILDRDKFKCKGTVPVLKVCVTKVGSILPHLKSVLLKLENFKPVRDCEENAEGVPLKIIFLHPGDVKSWSDFSSEIKTVLANNNIRDDMLETREIELSYDNWKADQILSAVLDDEESVRGYSVIGHIIQLNLRDHLLEYKKIIGEVLLDKCKLCKTVICKSDIVNNTYRYLDMEVIAGEEDFFVHVKENGVPFEFDFSKVYWNPRLEKEHTRILKQLQPSDVLFDVFCGVGPFAIPAAKRKVTVYANDLNPEAIKWLTHNAKLNKIKQNKLCIFNDDGANFIANNFKEYLQDICKGKVVPENKIHVTMNLPAIAVEFLQHFIGILVGLDIRKLTCDIIVHVYCFTGIEYPEKVAEEMVKENIRYDISEDIISVFKVRKVAPKKEMMRVSFKLPYDVLLGNVINLEPQRKKVCK